MRHRVTRLTGPLLVVLALSAVPGCGPKNLLNADDELRRQNMELAREVESLQEQLRLRTAEVESWRAQVYPGELPPGVNPPVLAGIEIDRYSGPVDLDRDGTDDVARIYVRPIDQQGRMIPVAGTLNVRLVTVPETGEPAVLAEATLDPAALDDAFRQGFTGPYYQIELALPADTPEMIAARVTLQQAGLDVTVSDQAGYRVQSAG